MSNQVHILHTFSLVSSVKFKVPLRNLKFWKMPKFIKIMDFEKNLHMEKTSNNKRQMDDTNNNWKTYIMY